MWRTSSGSGSTPLRRVPVLRGFLPGWLTLFALNEASSLLISRSAT